MLKLWVDDNKDNEMKMSMKLRARKMWRLNEVDSEIEYKGGVYWVYYSE